MYVTPIDKFRETMDPMLIDVIISKGKNAEANWGNQIIPTMLENAIKPALNKSCGPCGITRVAFGAFSGEKIRRLTKGPAFFRVQQLNCNKIANEYDRNSFMDIPGSFDKMIECSVRDFAKSAPAILKGHSFAECFTLILAGRDIETEPIKLDLDSITENVFSEFPELRYGLKFHIHIFTLDQKATTKPEIFSNAMAKFGLGEENVHPSENFMASDEHMFVVHRTVYNILRGRIMRPRK